MIKKEIAVMIKERTLKVANELDSLITECGSECSAEDLQIIKRGVGLSIGTIATELMEPIFKQHPEIDDLK